MLKNVLDFAYQYQSNLKKEGQYENKRIFKVNKNVTACLIVRTVSALDDGVALSFCLLFIQSDRSPTFTDRWECTYDLCVRAGRRPIYFSRRTKIVMHKQKRL